MCISDFCEGPYSWLLKDPGFFHLWLCSVSEPSAFSQRWGNRMSNLMMEVSMGQVGKGCRPLLFTWPHLSVRTAEVGRLAVCSGRRGHGFSELYLLVSATGNPPDDQTPISPYSTYTHILPLQRIRPQVPFSPLDPTQSQTLQVCAVLTLGSCRGFS